MEALGFEGGPEAFHRSVVVAASLAAHAWGDLVGEQKLAEGTGGILDSAIRMMELWTARPAFKRPLESFLNQGRGQGVESFQPTRRLEHRSSSAAKYSQPSS